MKPWFVYMVECADGTFYTGVTDDLNNRLATHNAGRGAKYTKGRVPVVLRFKEELSGRGNSQKREAELKKLSRRAKINLCDKIPSIRKL